MPAKPAPMTATFSFDLDTWPGPSMARFIRFSLRNASLPTCCLAPSDAKSCTGGSAIMRDAAVRARATDPGRIPPTARPTAGAAVAASSTARSIDLGSSRSLRLAMYIFGIGGAGNKSGTRAA
eukprot:scaffold7616_cov100-Isochrysis_galbana.AAC.4